MRFFSVYISRVNRNYYNEFHLIGPNNDKCELGQFSKKSNAIVISPRAVIATLQLLPPPRKTTAGPQRVAAAELLVGSAVR